ncbi:transporter [Lithospermum erythrorhizon]|uniref:Transporter n=1 Tax=Lithospermum erythrorhizon TaxID=34254 RepID=A0AAV3RSF8_LITER
MQQGRRGSDTHPPRNGKKLDVTEKSPLVVHETREEALPVREERMFSRKDGSTVNGKGSSFPSRPWDRLVPFMNSDEKKYRTGKKKGEKAAVETKLDNIKEGPINPCRLCTVTQVEELKAITRLLPIWAIGIILSTVYGQMGTLFDLQGETMDKHVGNTSSEIPPASLWIFETLTYSGCQSTTE